MAIFKEFDAQEENNKIDVMYKYGKLFFATVMMSLLLDTTVIATTNNEVERFAPKSDSEPAHIKSLRKEAQNGNAKAQNDLAVMYARGRGVTQDFARARTWYQRAADQDYAPAQYNLGVMYETGKGIA